MVIGWGDFFFNLIILAIPDDTSSRSLAFRALNYWVASDITLVLFYSRATVVTECVVKIIQSPIFESLPFLFKSIFSGCKALSHAISGRIKYLNKLAAQSQCAPSERRTG